jgi:hypothetical protein
MSEVEELEARISKLTRQDMARLRDWFLQLDNQLWDQQIAADFKAGKFNGLMDKARAELVEGKAREL